MNPADAAKPSQSLRVVAIGIALLSVLFAVGLGVLIFYMVRPQGDKIGDTSLMDPNAAQLVSGKVGDSLFFRTDVSIAVPRLSLVNDDQLEREASQKLSQSLLTVRATAPSGGELIATCAIYKGRAVSSTSTSGTFSRSGMLNDCRLALNETGSWKVRGSVAWVSDLSLLSAKLETRSEPAQR